MVLKMLYILPMILGRTFDARNDQIGIDIFSQDQLDTKEIHTAPLYESTYKIIKNSQDVKKVLDVSGDLSLKVKSGKVDLKGTGSYLKDIGRAENTIEILTRVKFYTQTVYLPFSVKPVQDWTNHRSEDLGTHYVRSITYGGELIASLKFIVFKSEDFQNIEASINAGIQGMQLENLVAQGKLQKLQKDLEGKANMEITYFATVPLKGVPNTLEGLQILIEGFKDQVQKINNGTGVPVRVELFELSNFDSRFSFLKNGPLESSLRTFEDEFDDLRKTREKLVDWIRSLPPTLTEEQEHKISDFSKRVDRALRPFYDAIGNLDIEKGPEQLEQSRQAYKEKGSAVPGKFNREFEKLKNNVNVKDPETTYVGKSTYVRWGANSCNSSTSTEVYNGYVATGAEMGVGGGCNYLCINQDPNLGMRLIVDRQSMSSLGGVKYGFGESELFPETQKGTMFGNGVLCNVCHTGNRSTVYTHSGAEECPEGWVREYSGYLVSNKDAGHRGQYVCLDKEPQYHTVVSSVNSDQNLELVAMSIGGDSVVVNCVVCSK